MFVSANQFEDLARAMLSMKERQPDRTMSDEDNRIFRAHYGVTFPVLSDLWRRLEPKTKISQGARPYHLMWAFILLKVCASESVHCRIAKVSDRKNFRHWSWVFIHAISALESQVVSFNNNP